MAVHNESFDGSRQSKEIRPRSFSQEATDAPPPRVRRIVSPDKVAESRALSKPRQIFPSVTGETTRRVSPMDRDESPEIHASIPQDQIPEEVKTQNQPIPPSDRLPRDIVQPDEIGIRREPRDERVLPNEPHDEQSPQGDKLEKLGTYRRISRSARAIYSYLERVDEAEETVNQYGEVQRTASWSNTLRDGDRITTITSYHLTTDGSLEGYDDRLTLTRKTTNSMPDGGRIIRDTSWVMLGEGTVVDYGITIAEPPAKLRGTTGPDVPGPRHALPEVELPGQRDPVSDSFPTIGRAERYEPLQEHNERVERGDPREGNVTTAGRDELIRILEERAEGTIFRVEHITEAAGKGPVTLDNRAHAAVLGTSLDEVIELIRTGVLRETGPEDIHAVPTRVLEPVIQTFSSAASKPILDALEDPAARAEELGVAAGRDAQLHAANKALGLPIEDTRLAGWLEQAGAASDIPEELGLATGRANAVYEVAKERKGFLLAIGNAAARANDLQIAPGEQGDFSVRFQTGENGLLYKMISGIQALGPQEEEFINDLRTSRDIQAVLTKWEAPIA